jgi:hypothetical protein
MSMDHIVLEQSLLKVNEVFIYQIPPLSSSSGFRAEDWNLASPLATCSLSVLQIDDVGILRLFQNVPKENAPEGATEERLFAESKIKLAENKLEHWVQSKKTVCFSFLFVASCNMFLIGLFMLRN